MVQDLLAAGEHRLGASELALDAATSDELPFGGDDRLALGVVHRMLAEPAAGVVDERAVLQRVDAAGRDLRDRWGLVGPEGGDGDDRGDDEVDRDDVDGALRGAGECAEQSAGVGDDHGLGHPEAADPARLRFGEGRLDDRRSDDRDGDGALHVGERLLAERLGERVGVRPADAGRPRPARLDQLVLDPPLADLFGLRRERRCAGGAEFGAGLGAELDEVGRLAARRIAVGAEAAAGGDLAAPVDADVERAVADEDLRCVAASVAGDVARRHGDEVGRDAELVAQVGDARRAEQVDLDRRVERRIERDGRRRVDDDVARRPRCRGRRRSGRARRG